MIVTVGNCQMRGLERALTAQGTACKFFSFSFPCFSGQRMENAKADLLRYVSQENLAALMRNGNLLVVPSLEDIRDQAPDALVCNLFHESQPYVHVRQGYTITASTDSLFDYRPLAEYIHETMAPVEFSPQGYLERHLDFLRRLRESLPQCRLLLIQRIVHEPWMHPTPVSWLAAWERLQPVLDGYLHRAVADCGVELLDSGALLRRMIDQGVDFDVIAPLMLKSDSLLPGRPGALQRDMEHLSPLFFRELSQEMLDRLGSFASEGGGNGEPVLDGLKACGTQTLKKHFFSALAEGALPFALVADSNELEMETDMDALMLRYLAGVMCDTGGEARRATASRIRELHQQGERHKLESVDVLTRWMRTIADNLRLAGRLEDCGAMLREALACDPGNVSTVQGLLVHSRAAQDQNMWRSLRNTVEQESLPQEHKNTLLKELAVTAYTCGARAKAFAYLERIKTPEAQVADLLRPVREERLDMAAVLDGCREVLVLHTAPWMLFDYFMHRLTEQSPKVSISLLTPQDPAAYTAWGVKSVWRMPGGRFVYEAHVGIMDQEPLHTNFDVVVVLVSSLQTQFYADIFRLACRCKGRRRLRYAMLNMQVPALRNAFLPLP